MWQWLTESNNSAAVQGLAAILNLLITLILAGLTGCYVYLTRKMLLTQQKQFRTSINAQGQEALRAKKRLALLISRFDRVLDSLPWEKDTLARFTGVALWRANDMETIEEAVLSVGPESATVAGDFVDSVRWLASEHQKVQSDPESISAMDVEEYHHRLMTAKTKLNEIMMVLVDSVGTEAGS